MKRKVIYVDKMTEQLMDDLSQIQSILSEISSVRLEYWMDVKEAAKYAKVSETTIRRAVAKGELQVSRKTSKLLFMRGWIYNWLRNETILSGSWRYV
jgi:excisionase family DNA binding protein